MLIDQIAKVNNGNWYWGIYVINRNSQSLLMMHSMVKTWNGCAKNPLDCLEEKE